MPRPVPWFSPLRVSVFVNLRSLKTSAVIHVDRFPLAERVERRLAGFAMAIAGVSHPAEWQMNFAADRAGVDVHDGRPDITHGALRPVDVPREDRRGQPVLDAVVDRNGLLELLHFDHAQHRPEALLLTDPHRGLHLITD